MGGVGRELGARNQAHSRIPSSCQTPQIPSFHGLILVLQTNLLTVMNAKFVWTGQFDGHTRKNGKIITGILPGNPQR